MIDQDLSLSPSAAHRFTHHLVRLSSDDVLQETSARYRAEQWLQRHPEAGSSWPSCEMIDQDLSLSPDAAHRFTHHLVRVSLKLSLQSYLPKAISLNLSL